MRVLIPTMVALGFVGAMAVGSPSATLAQEIYFRAPGVVFGIGRPWYRDRYRYYRSYNYVRPHVYFDRRTYGHGMGRSWMDIQALRALERMP
jgi:hypothetical protein